jgi:hypothetical protein
LKALGQDPPGRMGKLNVRISNKSHHGHKSPLAPH